MKTETRSAFAAWLPDDWDPCNNAADPIIHIDSETRRFSALVAPYDVCIIDGTQECWTAPKSPTAYSWAHAAHSGGEQGPAAWIGWSMNHADHRLSSSATRDHYANTAAAVSLAKYYDLEQHGGIFAFGVCAPHLNDIDLMLLRTMSLSGDWRRESRRQPWDLCGSQVVLNPAFRRDGQRSNFSAQVDEFAATTIFTSPEMGNVEDLVRAASVSGATMFSFNFEEKPMCQCQDAVTAAAPEPVVDSETVRTAAVPAPMLDLSTDPFETFASGGMFVREELMVVTNKAPGDGRAIAPPLDYSLVPFNITVDHSGGIVDIIGRVTGVRVEDNKDYGTIEIDPAYAMSDLAVRLLSSGAAGWSVELDSTTADWIPAAYLAQRGVDVGNYKPDDEVMYVENGRVRTLSLVVTPAHAETTPNLAGSTVDLEGETVESESSDVEANAAALELAAFIPPISELPNQEDK